MPKQKCDVSRDMETESVAAGFEGNQHVSGRCLDRGAIDVDDA
jgi:hypothetical protein